MGTNFFWKQNLTARLLKSFDVSHCAVTCCLHSTKSFAMTIACQLYIRIESFYRWMWNINFLCIHRASVTYTCIYVYLNLLLSLHDFRTIFKLKLKKDFVHFFYLKELIESHILYSHLASNFGILIKFFLYILFCI